MDNINSKENLIPLKDAFAEKICGGKASNLAHSLKLGINVPFGFVITDNAYQLFLIKNNLTVKINDLLRSLDPKNIQQLKIIENKIQKIVIAAPLMQDFKLELKKIWETNFNGKTLIIRSSGVGEDSKNASFAGQLDSFLNITSYDELLHTVKKCWASYWSARVLSYQYTAGIQLNGMGVIVQEQIESKFAGVLFTSTPSNQSIENNDEMLGEYCFGQGNKLVSGEITPGEFRISRNDLKGKIISIPEQVKTLNSKIDLSILTKLGKIGLQLEKYFKHGQDVEWATADDNTLYIVQSRPIVALNHKSKPGITWSNANVRENFPDPITPFLYSIASKGYSYYFKNLAVSLGVSTQRINAMQSSLNNIIGVHGARMYYNLSSIHDVIRMAPFGDRLVKFFNSFVGADEQPPSQPNTSNFKDPARNRIWQYLELLYICSKSSVLFLSIERRVKKFEAIINNYAVLTHPDKLQKMNIIELRNCMREFMNVRCNKWNNAALADVSALISYGVLQSLLQRAFPDKEQGAIINNLLKGCTDLVSSEPVHELWNLSRQINNDQELRHLFSSCSNLEVIEHLKGNPDKISFNNFYKNLNVFIENYGFRCSGELLLTVPTFQEKPAELIEIIKSYIQVDHDSPEFVLQSQQAERKQFTKQVLKDLSQNHCSTKAKWPGYAFLVKLMIAWTHKSIKYRERARFKQALLYSRLRWVMMTMGEKLSKQKVIKNASDILFLSYHEIDDITSSQSMFPYNISQTIKSSLEEHKILGAMEIPDSFTLQEGEYYDVINTKSVNCINSLKNNNNELSGTIACGGKVTSRATILNSVSESDKLQTNDILVTTQTDPGWSHIFFLIKGLVIERGGMLSHGAILAREFGIPAVVGIKNVTQLIPQHATIVLDADQGVVHVMD